MNPDGTSTATRYTSFDLIRGISAIAVTASHLRAAMFVDYSELPSKNIFTNLLYFVTSLGHEAVIVFFVLSGFFVGGSVLKKIDRFSWTSYSEARLTRLWMVLIPALIMTASVDMVTMKLAPETLEGAYRSLWSSGPSQNTPWTISPWIALSNIAFIQTIITPVYGSNSPLWSLANEFWYYVLFPIGISLVFRFRSISVIKKITYAFVIIFCIISFKMSIWEGFVIWLFGAAAYAYRGTQSIRTRFVTSSLLMITFAVTLVLIKKSSFHGFGDVALGFVFAGIVWALAGIPQNMYEPFRRFSEFISEISYSLYLFHFPVVILIASVFYRKKQAFPNLSGLAQFLGWMTVLFAGAVIFWWAFERRTPELRRWISSKNKKLTV